MAQVAQPSQPSTPQLPAQVWRQVPFTISSTCSTAGGTGAQGNYYKLYAFTRQAAGGQWIGLGSGSDWALQGTPAEISATYSATWLPGLYEIYVQAVNNLNEVSDRSIPEGTDLQLDTTPPDSPPVPSGASQVPVGVDATFSSISTYENTLSGVKIKFEYGPANNPTSWKYAAETAWLNPGIDVSFVVIGAHLSIAGEYWIRAMAIDRAGNESPPSDWFSFWVGSQPVPPIPSRSILVQPHTATNLKLVYQKSARQYSLDGSEDEVELDAPQPYIRSLANGLLREIGLAVPEEKKPEEGE